MNRFFQSSMIALLIFPWVAPVRAHAEPPSHLAQKISNERRLRALAGRIDRDTAGIARTNHIELLADQFHVPLSVIEEMRQKGQRWGDITIQLAMAQSLCAKDPVHYGTPADALFQIQLTRAENKSWSRTARVSGLRLKPILIMTAQSYRSLKSSGQIEHAAL